MNYIHTEEQLHERGKRIAAIIPALRNRPEKAYTKEILFQYARRLNDELIRAHQAPDMPSISTMEGYEEMRHSQMLEAEKKRY